MLVAAFCIILLPLVVAGLAIRLMIIRQHDPLNEWEDKEYGAKFVSIFKKD